MNIVDAIIILLIVFGGVVGFKRGFFKQTLVSLGWIVVLILAFMFKDALALFLMNSFPFINVGGIFEGVKSINILIYEVIAFLLLGALLTVILKILIKLTGWLEKFLNFTIFLGIPSKILGAFMGMLEAYLIVIVILFIISLPIFNIDFVQKSKLKDQIFDGTPIISKYLNKTVTVFDEIIVLKDKYEKSIDSTQFDKDIIELLVSNNIVSEDTIIRLKNQNKLNK